MKKIFQKLGGSSENTSRTAENPVTETQAHPDMTENTQQPSATLQEVPAVQAIPAVLPDELTRRQAGAPTVCLQTGEAQNAPLSDADLIAAYLRANPDFFLDREDLIEEMAFPTGISGLNVTALNDFQMRKLRQKLDVLEDKQRTIIRTSVQNMESTKQIHSLILRMLHARTLMDLQTALEAGLKIDLNVDNVRLMFTPTVAAFAAGGKKNVTQETISEDEIRPLMDGDKLVHLRMLTCEEDKHIHGKRESDIASDALIHLATRETGTLGLLIIGSQDRQRFHPGQGADLLEFLGGVISCTIMRLADVPHKAVVRRG